MLRVLARILLTALLATVPLGEAAGATHADDDDARLEGNCAGGLSWKMEAKPDDGRIEIKVEIDTRRSGRRWSWVLKHNGSVSDRGTTRTRGSSGYFAVERLAVDVSGPDTFRFRATRKAAVCVARVSL